MVQRIKSGMIDNSLDFTNKTITSPSFSGNVSFDGGTLFVDSVGNQVGIGITNPGYTLAVAGSINSERLVNRTSFSNTQNLDQYYMGKTHQGSVSVPTNNAWTTVLTINGATLSGTPSSTGVNYGFVQDSNVGFIKVWHDWGNAWLGAWVSYVSKGAFNFDSLTIVNSYGYNSGIQISGTSIQVRQAGLRQEPVDFSFHSFG